uniref:30S ribosomal protein S7P n=1 Tax=Lygus hesperus TaxID=30085 RepID=A0A0A9WUB5_LYGHE
MVPKKEKKTRGRRDAYEDEVSDDKPLNIKPPEPIDVSDSGMAPLWRKWIQQWDWYVIASRLDNKREEIQVATFMSALGPDVIDIFNSFDLNDEEAYDLELIKNKFEEYFVGKTNVTYERYLFNKITQSDCQSFDDFCTKIKNQANICEFKDLRDSLIKDKIVIGIKDDKTREKLLIEENLTLTQAIKIYKAHESAKQNL